MNAWNTRLAGAGLLVALVALLVALDAHGARTPDSPSTRPPTDRSIEDLRRDVLALRHETSTLRAELDARPEPTGASSGLPAETTGTPAVADPATPKDDPARPDDLLALGKQILARTASPEDTARFWKLARSPGVVDGLLERLEAEVADDPTSADARMRLADAYVIKLFTVPPGPEMGRWGGKAEAEWRAVLSHEPSHWQARFNLAVSLSYHPDVEGVTPDAIRHLTRLVEEQEHLAPEPRQADVYRLLATLHRRQGDADAARKALRRGLERHPADEKLEKANRESER